VVAADPAAARLGRALESDDERSAIRAAQIILGRTGLGPAAAVEVTMPAQEDQLSVMDELKKIPLEERSILLEALQARPKPILPAAVYESSTSTILPALESCSSLHLPRTSAPTSPPHNARSCGASSKASTHEARHI